MEFLADILLVQAIFLAAVATPGPDFVAVSTSALNGGRLRAFRRGVVVNLGNPKALVLFTSLAALLVKPGTPSWVLAVSGAGIIAVTLIWYAAVVLALTHSRLRVRYRNFRYWLDRLAGTVLAFFGIRLITAG